MEAIDGGGCRFRWRRLTVVSGWRRSIQRHREASDAMGEKMAVFDVRFTRNQRKRLHRYVVFAILASLLIGLALFLMGLFASLAITTKLQLQETNLFELVFYTLTLYGLYVFFHNLMGMKLCYNYFHYAEGPWMNLRLFVWTLVGLLVVLVGCFMASRSFSTADYLTIQLRTTLLEGMKKYFTDVSWKRRIDSIQVGMQCCGIDSSDDWHKTYWLQREFLLVDSPDILRYAKLDGSVTPPVVPWSCCRIDVKGPCFHDPLQLPNPEQNSSYESLNPRGCLAPMKIMVNGTLYSAALMIAFLLVLQVTVSVLSRFDFTAARNAVALGDRWSGSPGWLFGRLDFGLARGPNLCQIDRKYSGQGDSMIDLRPLVYSSDSN